MLGSLQRNKSRGVVELRGQKNKMAIKSAEMKLLKKKLQTQQTNM